MAVNDVIRVTISQTSNNVTVLNTLHWKHTVVGTGTMEQVLANAIDARIGTYLIPRQSDQWQYMETLAQKIYPSPTGRAYLSATNTGVGTDTTNDASPPTVAYTVTLRTAFAGRRYRGRIYVTGYQNGQASGGLLDNTFKGLVTTAWNNIIASVTSSGHTFIPVLYHRDDHSVDAITDINIAGVERNQRRRQTDRGI